MLGWRLSGGFPTLAGLSMELRAETRALTESSDGRAGDGEGSFSSGTGVGGLLKILPFFALREDSIGVENCGWCCSSSLCSASKSSSSEDGPSKPANKLLVRNGLLILLSLFRAKGPLSLFPGYRSSILSVTLSSNALRSCRAEGTAVLFSMGAVRFTSFLWASFGFERSCPGSGVPGLDVIAEGNRCGGSLLKRLSIMIGSVCIPIVRMVERISIVVWVAALLVPGGNMGSLGEEGVDDGAWIAMEGMVIGTGGGARVGAAGICGFCSDVSTGSVWVAMEATSGR